MARFVFEDGGSAAPTQPAAGGRFVFEGEAAAAAPAVSKGVSLARGAGQGLTFGWLDEAAGGLAAALPFLDREATSPGLSDLIRGNAEDTLAARYRRARDFYRARNAAAQEANPGAYTTAEIGASVLPLLASGGTASAARVPKAAMAAGQGMMQGAGYSNASGTGLARDTALGGALGLAGRAVGQGVGKSLAWARRKGADLASKGAARAAQQGAEEATAPVLSVEAAARERAANAYRQMERIQKALQDPALPPAERAAIEAFKQSPEYAALVQANARGVLAVAPEALAELEAAKVVAAQARADLPQAIQARTQELMTPQVGTDVRSYLKAYAEPLAWAVGGQQIGSALGLDPTYQLALGGAAGVIGGRTRAGKALWTRLTRPAHQIARGETLRSLASGRSANALERMLGPVGATSSILATTDGED